MDALNHGYFDVPVAGSTTKLSFYPGECKCGDIADGVAFKFDGEGCWVIALDTLKEMVSMAEYARATAVNPTPDNS